MENTTLRSENLKRLLDEVLEIDDSIRFVGMLDDKENTLRSKLKDGKISRLTPSEDEKFSLDLRNMKKIQDSFNEQLGAVTYMYINREKIPLLVYFCDDLVIYVSCEPNVEYQHIMKIVDKLEKTLQEIRIDLNLLN